MILSSEEDQRLFELHDLNLVDSPDEERFDRITKLAATFFRVPTSLISLVDRKRQWFKSRVGMAACSTPREIAICHHAIREDEFMVVNDLSLDPRFCDNPLVTDQQMRFYAGAVLRSVNGHALGTLCILDTRPREFSKEQLASLLEFARLAERELNEGSRLESWREHLLQQTLFDPCSKLPGRRFFLEQSRTLLTRMNAAAMVVIGIDDYALSALDLSREEQSKLNKQLADNIRAVFKDAKISGDLGDGRYCGLLPVDSPKAAQSISFQDGVNNLQKAFSQPLQAGGRSIAPSVGISLYPKDGENPEQLLIKADLARPKRAAGQPAAVTMFSSEDIAEQQRSAIVESRLRGAIHNDSLSLFYQPKYCLASGSICGVEALLRWNDPVIGKIGPDEFIPIAEGTGLIQDITTWVIKRAWQQLPDLTRSLGVDVLTVAINLSASDLLRPGFPEWVEQSLRSQKISGQSIVFEITESSLVADIPQATKNMMALKALGITFHIDDFGTCYSNLNQLHQLPLDALKVDKSFVNQLGVLSNGDIVCKSIIALAKSLGLRVIAEGVETKEQLKTLTELGCTAVQGFLLGKPMDANELHNLPTTHAMAWRP
ncbi:MAG: EAL domain protein [Marinobacter excellens HL-55]|uniref:EAL domain protein n=1 Tax=Marinobacter excellens HL-55 TaxID=1305731 RepID=A0A0P8B181_9GAMM|nr:MAG: EAL domain protein [Marinobacter excellens HL-55]